MAENKATKVILCNGIHLRIPELNKSAGYSPYKQNFREMRLSIRNALLKRIQSVFKAYSRRIQSFTEKEGLKDHMEARPGPGTGMVKQILKPP